MYVITGGGTGIGKALAQALATRQLKVLIVGRREYLLQEVAATSSHISYVSADLTTAKGRERLLSRLKKETVLDGIIHGAVTVKPLGPMCQLDEAMWNKMMAINVNVPLFLNQLLIDKLALGRILHLNTHLAYEPSRGLYSYCVSKAALSMLTRCWQLQHSKPVTCASVIPGVVDTPLMEKVRRSKTLDREVHRSFVCLKEQNKLVKPETVALFLTWLLLDVDNDTYKSKEWSIYDNSHHKFWLKEPHGVPGLE